MYKDEDKQREANRKAKARQRRRDGRRQPKGMTVCGTKEGMTGNTSPMLDEVKAEGITEREFIEEVSKIYDVPIGLKRGKDIKCFADLPTDVQEDIDKMSVFNGKIDRMIKIKRTEAAIRYQRLFPRPIPQHRSSIG
jgi:hypothetical protein